MFAFRVAIYDSLGACEDWVGRMLEIGIRELILWYPGDDRASEAVLERFAADSMPRIRAATA